ncbi:glycosyltransferase [Kineococcus siccus]|uniref:glycosyltransferase n=1 Tax=Kineococcus siccus TaxID=2696567 RepID=UPI00196AD578
MTVENAVDRLSLAERSELTVVSAAPPPREEPWRLRVLVLALGWDRPGGLNRYVQGLHEAVSRDGGAVRTLVLGPAESAPAGVTAAAADTASLPVRLRAFARQARRFGRGADVVDVHFALLSFGPVVLGALRGKPLVVHFHGPWAEESLEAGESRRAVLRAKHRLERAVYARAHRLVVLSDAFADLLVREYGVDRARVRVVPPGVDLDAFSPGRSPARRRLGLAPDRRVVFTARRLVSRMGLDVLLAAWQSVERRPDDLLLIAGEGPEDTALAGIVEQAGLGESVRLLGRIDEDDLVAHFRAADVCVMPSLALEGFGLTAVEALACGTPVVVTDVGGLPDVVRDLDPSLTVPPGDPGALAARLSSALAGRVPDATACRRHAETFSWHRAAETHRRLYAEAVEEAGAR